MGARRNRRRYTPESLAEAQKHLQASLPLEAFRRSAEVVSRQNAILAMHRGLDYETWLSTLRSTGHIEKVARETLCMLLKRSPQHTGDALQDAIASIRDSFKNPLDTEIRELLELENS